MNSQHTDVNEDTAEDDSPGYERSSTNSKRRDFVGEKKIKRTLDKLGRTLRRGNVENMTEWEGDFLSDVTVRIMDKGAAFNDREKGDISEPISILQSHKLKEIVKEMKMRDDMGMKEARRLVFAKKRKP